MMYSLSVITVVKNDQNNIVKTIKSVLNQKNLNFEYIIHDGKSSDYTFNKVKKFKKKNIKIIRETDVNLYDAINKCIKKANGEYIILIHSGDIFFDDFVLFNLQKILIRRPDILSGNIKFYKNYRSNIIRNWIYPIKVLNKFSIFKIPHTALIVKKNIFKKLGFYNIKYNISSDMDLMIKLSKLKNLKYVYLNKYITLMSADGLSTSKINFFKKLIQDLKILVYHFKFYFIFYYILKVYFKIFDYLGYKNINTK